MSRIRRPRRVDRAPLYLLAGAGVAASATAFTYWVFSISDDPFAGFAGFVILVLAVPIIGASLALAGVRWFGSGRQPEAQATRGQRLRELVGLLPTGRGLLDLESGRRMWISTDEVGRGEGLRTVTSVVCLDIAPDDDFAMTTTVYTLTGAGVKRTTGTVTGVPDDRAAAALAAPIPKGAEVAEAAELEELYAQLDRAVLADDRGRKRLR